MSTQTTEPKEPSFWKKLWRIFWTLIVFVFVVALIAAGVYFVAPFIYQEYVEPVQEHSFQLDLLAEQAQQIDARHTERMDSIADRLQELELQGDSYKSGFASLEERMNLVETAQSDQADSLDALLPLQAAVGDIEAQLSNLQSDLDEIQTARRAIEADIAELQERQSEFEEVQVDTAANLEEIQVGMDLLTAQAGQVTMEIQLLKVMELITRARYNLVDGNFTLSRADIQSARDITAGLQVQAPPNQAEALAEIASRLDTSLANLAGSPLSAANQLEAAWQILIQGFPTEPGETETTEGTVTPTPTPTPTPAP